VSEETTAYWLQLTLETLLHNAEQLEDALLQAGAIAVILQNAGDQPIFEPLPGALPLWSHTQVTGLFDAQTDIAVVKQSLRLTLGDDSALECRLEKIPERDWVRAWLDHFHPMRFGKRLWVCPKNQTPPDSSGINVFLDPGLAFGTGTHPTTALCLTWLDCAELANKTVIDYGCGSGILAIAAAKLGANRVWAVDIDPQALMSSAQNVNENGMAKRIVLSAPAQLPTEPVDLLLANIVAGTLIQLASHFSTLVRQQGQLVLSGMLIQQAEEVRAAFIPWFDFRSYQQQEGWVLLQAVRNY
jgi:ribosomal protein L11 methyltransferase